jgi:Fe-S cluster assembly iron-binding protein IscA
MKELQAGEASDDEKMLRLTVETGGCSGFQYVFDLDGKTNSDDRYRCTFVCVCVFAHLFLF